MVSGFCSFTNNDTLVGISTAVNEEEAKWHTARTKESKSINKREKQDARMQKAEDNGADKVVEQEVEVGSDGDVIVSMVTSSPGKEEEVERRTADELKTLRSAQLATPQN